MDLLLWRHAEAADGSPDSMRTLTSRGEKQAQHMAKWLEKHAPAKLRVLVSPTTRTRQTVEAWLADYEIVQQVGVNATAQDVLDAAGWPDASSGDAVMVVGHQPTLGQVASILLCGEDADMVVKKGALWWFQLRRNEDAEGDGEEVILKTVISPDLL